MRKADFFDGQRFHIWVGREFGGLLALKLNGAVIGRYELSKLDTASYGADPKTKPEPLLVAIGQKQEAEVSACTPNDPLGVGHTQLLLSSMIAPKLQFMNKLGSQFDYAYPQEEHEVKEHVVITEVGPAEIQPQALKQLETGPAIGRPTEIFVLSKEGSKNSLLYKAISAAAANIAGDATITSNWFKETAGYLQENFRAIDKLAMTVRIEKKVKGKYKVLIKGKPMTQLIAQSLGAGKAKVVHHRSSLGAEKSKFIDGGFGRTGKAGYGSARRLVMTATENFHGGLKIQVIGTVIDLFVDANSVFLSEKGSGDLSEFLGRAGVSIAKAGATAALGSVFAAAGTAFVTTAAVALSATGATVAAPVIAVVAVVVGGYILAATIVDYADNKWGVKEKVAKEAR